VIPETAGALIAFLSLVAPGIVFYLVRDRYTPARKLTTFREASVVALTSLVFTVTAALLLLALARTTAGAWLPDLGAWAAHGDAYFDAHVGSALLGLTAQTTLAALLAGLAARLLYKRSNHGSISGVGTWFQAFREDRPQKTTPWLRVELDDASIVWGYLKHYTTDESFEKGEITVVGPGLAVQDKNGAQRDIPEWYSVMIPGSKMRSVSLVYISDENGERLNARQPDTSLIGLRKRRPRRAAALPAQVSHR
jgi:hypothetical protein